MDDSGKLSVGRALMCLLVIIYLALAGYLSIKTSLLVDIPAGAIGLIVVLYGVNKFSPTVPFTKAGKTPSGGEKAE